MILWIDGNSGVLFIPQFVGVIKKYISGVINTFSTVTGNMFGTGLLVGSVNTFSATSGKLIGRAFISGVINTFSRVTGEMNTFLIIEYLRLKSTVTRILKFKSKI